MNKIKVITLLTVVSLFLITPYNNAMARDCSNPKGFHQVMMCKVSGNSLPSGEKKSNPNNFWNKIKNFGGKNVGEAG